MDFNMKIFITITFILSSTLCFGQKDTLKLPTQVAKQIAIELLACDSTKAMLTSTKEELELCKLTNLYKDSLLQSKTLSYVKLDTRFQTQKSLTNSYKTLYLDTKNQYNTLASELKRVHGDKTAIEIGGGFIVLTLLYLLIIK